MNTKERKEALIRCDQEDDMDACLMRGRDNAMLRIQNAQILMHQGLLFEHTRNKAKRFLRSAYEGIINSIDYKLRSHGLMVFKQVSEGYSSLPDRVNLFKECHNEILFAIVREFDVNLYDELERMSDCVHTYHQLMKVIVPPKSQEKINRARTARSQKLHQIS